MKHLRQKPANILYRSDAGKEIVVEFEYNLQPPLIGDYFNENYYFQSYTDSKPTHKMIIENAEKVFESKSSSFIHSVKKLK